MPSDEPDGSAMSPWQRHLVDGCRTATLATVAADGRPRLVPICFALEASGARVYSPLDEKPKRGTDPHDLARVRDIRVRPEVTLLFHHWSEDWSALAWVRVIGRATLMDPLDDPPTHAAAVRSLRVRYPQYADQRLETRPMLRIDVTGVTSWAAER